MNKKLVIAAIIVIAIAAGFGYLLIQDEASAPETQMATEPVSPSTTSIQPGAYVYYQESLIADTPGTKVLFFHAPWCPQCRQLESEIKVGPLPDNTTVFKVDYDTNQSLRQKYGVSLQTTLVQIDDQGNLVKKYVAYDDPTLDSLKQNIL